MRDYSSTTTKTIIILSLIILVIIPNLTSCALLSGSRYIDMSTEELSALSDDELYEAVIARLDHKINEYDDMQEGINSLSYKQKVVYSVSYLEMEVNNGGLCQFFVNSSRYVSPHVSEYMGVIGAVEHKKLYDGFVKKHYIDLDSIASVTDLERPTNYYNSLYAKYPFSEYDEAFVKITPLRDFLLKYIRANLGEF